MNYTLCGLFIYQMCIINVENVQCFGPPCNIPNARERIECKSNITSPDWHPEFVMRCDAKVMNFEFVSEFVFPLKSGFHVTYFPAFDSYWKRVFSPPLLLVRLLFFFALAHHQSRCSKLSWWANLTQWKERASEREDAVECRIEQEKESILSFFLKSFKCFFHFTILKVRIERCKNLQLYKRCRRCMAYRALAFNNFNRNKNDFSLLLLLNSIKIMLNMYGSEFHLNISTNVRSQILDIWWIEWKSAQL